MSVRRVLNHLVERQKRLPSRERIGAKNPKSLLTETRSDLGRGIAPFTPALLE